jgi:Helicase HerA, central domain/Bacterial protein of unknown function (DUF853)
MRHYLGIDSYAYNQKSQVYKIDYEPAKLINSHMLIAGMSGTGKSYQSMRMLETAARSGIEIDIFDVHEELDGIKGSKSVKYSQATRYGYNPLVLDTDPHTGGVNRQADFLVDLIKQVSPIGIIQESALRNLIVSTYASIDITPGNPRSWIRQEMNDEIRQQIIEAEDYKKYWKYYPTLDDLILHGKNKIIALTIGTDNPSVVAYSELMAQKKKLYSSNLKARTIIDEQEILNLENKIVKTQQKCIELYSAHIQSMRTGQEPDDIIKFESAELISGIVTRLELLANAGTFSANPPPFGQNKVRVHQIKSLLDDQQVMFVKLRLRAIFEQCKKLGPTESGTALRHIVFLDEAHKYFNNNPSDIINVIAKEARKFGLGLWCASQSPLGFPEDFLSNVGAIMFLGISSMYWKKTTNSLRITEETLMHIKPKQTMAVKLQREGYSDPPFKAVIVPNPTNPAGAKAASFQK